MPSQIQFDIAISAAAPIVQAIGTSNLLTNGGFESFEVLSPFLPADWIILPVPPAVGSPTFGPETVIFDEGTKSLKWSHDGTGQRPSIQQIFTAQSYMNSKTMKITGKIKSSSSSVETLSMSIGINGVLSPTLVLPNGSQNSTVETSETGVVFNMNYDNQRWYDFDFYYHVPEAGIFSIGPVLFPTAEDSTTEVYLDDVKVFFEVSNRSESWRIELEPVNNLIYGYGYGYSYDFIDIEDSIDGSELSFFNVFGVLGENEGIGYDNTVTNIELPPELTDYGYSYAFGYEYAAAFLANSVDSITVKAVVYENNVRQPNVRVVFKASPHVILNPHSTTTNAFGEAYTDVSLDIETLQNTLRQPSGSILSSIPFNGVLMVQAEIDKNPEEDEGIVLVQTQAIQLTSTSLQILDIGVYGFSRRYGYSYGYTGYGYDPFSDDFVFFLG